jgi:chitinase
LTVKFFVLDVDWEYPGGNGADYKQIPNSDKTSEITTFPLLLKEIKSAIGSKELSIAVPGRDGDMIAYTAATVPTIAATVDFVNVSLFSVPSLWQNPNSQFQPGHDL